MRKPSPKRDSITELFTKFAGQANTLTIPCPYIDFCNGDHLAALLLSQILYWTDRTEDPDGWFAKSYEDWYKETRLTKRQVMRIIGKDKRQKEEAFSLKAVGVETEVKRSKHYEGQAAMRYRVNFEVLSQHVLDYVSGKVTNAHLGKVTNGNSLEVTNAHSSKVTKGNSYITETTAKNTSETTKREETPALVILPEAVAANGGLRIVTHTPKPDIAPIQSEMPIAAGAEPNPPHSARSPLPPHIRNFEASFKPLHTLLEIWYEAHPQIKPTIPRTQRENYNESAADLAAAGVTADNVREFVKYRLNAGLKTGWTFIVADIHDYLNGKNKPVKQSTFTAADTPAPQKPIPANLFRPIPKASGGENGNA